MSTEFHCYPFLQKKKKNWSVNYKNKINGKNGLFYLKETTTHKKNVCKQKEMSSVNDV